MGSWVPGSRLTHDEDDVAGEVVDVHALTCKGVGVGGVDELGARS